MIMPKLFLSLLLTLSCGIVLAQDKSKINWATEYKQLLESDPEIRQKIKRGETTKEEVIQWLQNKRGKSTLPTGRVKPPVDSDGKKSLSAFQLKLGELVEAGKLSKEDAAKLTATMNPPNTPQEKAAKQDKVDWEAEYEKLLKSEPALQQKVAAGGATKEQVIAYLKMKAGAKNVKGTLKKRGTEKPGARKGSVKFYAIVIGKLRSKDIELGELEMEVDYVLSDSGWAKKELIGQRVKLEGVAGVFLDNLLGIKRGETFKIRTGDYNAETKTLGFGYKFQVLERTPPFVSEEYGIPPEAFRGFHGVLTGDVVEALGYEVLLNVQEAVPADESKAQNSESVLGKRVRIAGFYNEHADAFADLHEGDPIRVSVVHRNLESDSLNVTDVLKKVTK